MPGQAGTSKASPLHSRGAPNSAQSPNTYCPSHSAAPWHPRDPSSPAQCPALMGQALNAGGLPAGLSVLLDSLSISRDSEADAVQAGINSSSPCLALGRPSKQGYPVPEPQNSMSSACSGHLGPASDMVPPPQSTPELYSKRYPPPPCWPPHPGPDGWPVVASTLMGPTTAQASCSRPCMWGRDRGSTLVGKPPRWSRAELCTYQMKSQSLPQERGKGGGEREVGGEERN